MIFSSERHMDWLVVGAKKRKPRLLGVQLILKHALFAFCKDQTLRNMKAY